MKLIFAVIRDKDTNEAVNRLVQAGIGVTKLASTGGFLRDGNTTLMIGTDVIWLSAMSGGKNIWRWTGRN